MEISKTAKINKERFFDKKTIFMTGQLILGTFIYSIGVVWLLNCGEFFAGGITGISQLLSYLFLHLEFAFYDIDFNKYQNNSYPQNKVKWYITFDIKPK